MEEWCWDGEDPEEVKYTFTSAFDPIGSHQFSTRVIRGGNAVHWVNYLSSAQRRLAEADERRDMLGFRLVRTTPTGDQ